MRLLLLNEGSRNLDCAALADPLFRHGIEVVDASQGGFELNEGSDHVALVLGLGNWHAGRMQDALARAGQLGILRVLWQLEPLLPSGPSPALASLVAGAHLPQPNPKGVFYSLKLQLLYLRVLVATWRERWGKGLYSPHLFKFPTEQTRALAATWRAGNLDQIWVSLASRKTKLDEIGIPSRLVPVGHAREFGQLQGDQDRDIDVLFLGQVSSRRRALLHRIGRQLEQAGFNLRVVSRDCYGETRTGLLNRTKIVLNLLKFPWEFPGMRMLMAISCGALVVSEEAPEPAPYVPGKHFVAAPIDELSAALIDCLRDEPRRLQMTLAAHRFVIEKMQMGRIISDALKADAHGVETAGA